MKGRGGSYHGNRYPPSLAADAITRASNRFGGEREGERRRERPQRRLSFSSLPLPPSFPGSRSCCSAAHHNSLQHRLPSAGCTSGLQAPGAFAAHRLSDWLRPSPTESSDASFLPRAQNSSFRLATARLANGLGRPPPLKKKRAGQRTSQNGKN